MRVMIMHRTTPRWEAGEIPTPELIARVGAMMRDLAQGNRLLGGEGLRASSLGARLRVRDGQPSVERGPFGGAAEPPAALAIVRVPDLDRAMEWAERLAGDEREIGIDVRPVTEPWDLGMMEKPADVVGRRYMLVEHRAEASGARSGAPSQGRAASEGRAARTRALGEMADAGVLLTSETLKPTAHGKRYRFAGGRHAVVDGPFAESKELIGGFVLLRVDSLEEAHPLAIRYGECIDVAEVDLREVEEPA